MDTSAAHARAFRSLQVCPHLRGCRPRCRSGGNAEPMRAHVSLLDREPSGGVEAFSLRETTDAFSPEQERRLHERALHRLYAAFACLLSGCILLSMTGHFAAPVHALTQTSAPGAQHTVGNAQPAVADPIDVIVILDDSGSMATCWPWGSRNAALLPSLPRLQQQRAQRSERTALQRGAAIGTSGRQRRPHSGLAL